MVIDKAGVESMKILDEQSMRYLEEQIPELAESAVNQAYYKALAAGRRVVGAVNGQLVESRPDGSFRVLKALAAAPTPVVPGQRRVRMRFP